MIENPGVSSVDCSSFLSTCLMKPKFRVSLQSIFFRNELPVKSTFCHVFSSLLSLLFLILLKKIAEITKPRQLFYNQHSFRLFVINFRKIEKQQIISRTPFMLWSNHNNHTWTIGNKKYNKTKWSKNHENFLVFSEPASMYFRPNKQLLIFARVMFASSLSRTYSIYFLRGVSFQYLRYCNQIT